MGELVAQFLARRKIRVKRVFETRQPTLEDDIANGSVDVYVDYTGAAYYLKFHQSHSAPPKTVYDFISREYLALGVVLSKPFPFQSEWAVYVRSGDPKLSKLKTISELAAFSKNTHKLVIGWPVDFDRDSGAGPKAMIDRYGLKVIPKDISIAHLYDALQNKDVEVAVGNSTDGQTLQGKFVRLSDDLQFFPPYEPVILAHQSTYARKKAFKELFESLSEKLSFDDVRQMNDLAQEHGGAPADLARTWLDAHKL